MRRFITDVPAPGGQPDFAALPAAIAQAHRLLDQKFSERCQVLAGGSARVAAEAELARAEKYYAEALASLARRQASAAPDRQALLAARADSVRAEQHRRLAEIEEKYASRHDIRPYRLYLLLVPVLRLPVDVLRGTRRFPLTLDWMLPAGAFAPVSCPGCGADTARWPLAAAKTRLGCASCLPCPAAEHAAPAVAGVTGALDRSRSENSGWGSSGASRGKGKAAGPRKLRRRAGQRGGARQGGAAGRPSRCPATGAAGREEEAGQRAGGEQGGRETGDGVLVGHRAGQPAGAAAAVRRRLPRGRRHPAVRDSGTGGGGRPGARRPPGEPDLGQRCMARASWPGPAAT